MVKVKNKVLNGKKMEVVGQPLNRYFLFQRSILSYYISTIEPEEPQKSSLTYFY
ncbi:MAG: hypothetical protein ABH873_07440 [Candidatus Firestonebacteria bacterium]